MGIAKKTGLYLIRGGIYHETHCGYQCQSTYGLEYRNNCQQTKASASIGIRTGRSYRQGPHIDSYHHVKGWQAVCRRNLEQTRLLVVVHSFEECGNELEIVLPDGISRTWDIIAEFHRDKIKVKLCNRVLVLQGMETYDGVAVLLGKETEIDY